MSENTIANQITLQTLALHLRDLTFYQVIKEIRQEDGELVFVHNAWELYKVADEIAPKAPWMPISHFAGLTTENELRYWCVRYDFMTAEEFNAAIDRLRPGKNEPECKQCNDTGSIESGDNDLPCHCPKGDTAVFNLAGHCQKTGAEIKHPRR